MKLLQLSEGLETWSTIPLPPPASPDCSSEPTPEDWSHLTVAVQQLADSALVATATRSYGSLPSRALQQVNESVTVCIIIVCFIRGKFSLKMYEVC